MSDKPNNAIDALNICIKDMYPGIFNLLQILATLPVSTASNERTFSKLKLIKTYLRNTISEVSVNILFSKILFFYFCKIYVFFFLE